MLKLSAVTLGQFATRIGAAIHEGRCAPCATDSVAPLAPTPTSAETTPTAAIPVQVVAGTATALGFRDIISGLSKFMKIGAESVGTLNGGLGPSRLGALPMIALGLLLVMLASAFLGWPIELPPALAALVQEHAMPLMLLLFGGWILARIAVARAAKRRLHYDASPPQSLDMALQLRELHAALTKLADYQRRSGASSIALNGRLCDDPPIRRAHVVVIESALIHGWQNDGDRALRPTGVVFEVEFANGSRAPVVEFAPAATTIRDDTGERTIALPSWRVAWAIRNIIRSRHHTKPQPLVDDNFPLPHEYQAPVGQDLTRVAKGRTDLKEDEVSNPASALDNRTAVRWFLHLRGISNSMFDRLVEPFDNGFYKKSDGESTPLGFLKITRVRRLLGFEKSVAAVRHDYDYYRGLPERQRADAYYRDAQIAVGMRPWRARIEYAGLRLFGGIAWRNHRAREDRIPEYGTEAYIEQLPDQY